MASDLYNIVYMDCSGQTIAQSNPFNLSISCSPQSMESFISISDDERAEDSFTIIDKHDLLIESESIISEEWDMASSIQLETKSVENKPLKNEQHQKEGMMTKEHHNEGKHPTQQTVVEQIMDSTGFVLEDLSIGSSLSQSVIMSKEEHVSQSRARLLQKHNKDLQGKLNRLSERLTEAKIVSQAKDDIINSKDEEIAQLKTALLEAQEENACLKTDFNIREVESNKVIENLQSIIKEKDNWSKSLVEEVEFLSSEKEKLKVALKSMQAEKKGKKEKKEYHVRHKSSRHRNTDDIQITRKASSSNANEAVAGVNDIDQSFESLKKQCSITVCPVCGKERPAHEDAMAMTIHMESCLEKKGFA